MILIYNIINNKNGDKIPKSIRDSLGLVGGDKLMVKQEENRIILIAKHKKEPKGLLVNASPDAVKHFLDNSRNIDENKLKELLKIININK